MKVLATAADKGGSFQYRVRIPVEAAQRRGVDVTYAHDFDVEATRNSVTGIVTVDEVHTDADVISIQRPSTQRMNALAVACKRQGIAVVTDLDDDLALVPKYNSAYSRVDPARSPLENYHWLEQTMAMADWVTVSTTHLLRYAVNGASVIYNAIDPAWLDITPRRPEMVGWTGTPHNHWMDLHQIRSGLVGLERRAGLHLITDDAPVVAKALGWTGRVVAAGWQDFEHYPVEIANKVGVGMVPLDTWDLFNQAKSFLKGLEFAALGIPFVASPTAQYKLLADGYRIGKLAKGPSQWNRLIGQALDQRDRLGDTYRARVAEDFTAEHTVDGWIDAWEQAYAQVRRDCASRPNTLS